MARRSARLLKRENTPDVSTKSADNSHTASPANVGLPDLPELPELPEPGTKTPSQSKPSEGAQSSSKLAQTTTTPTPTPHRNKSTKAPATVAEIHTPKDRTPIKPAGQEMHPAHHHASTAKILDEARWLGFQSLGAHTAPPKAVGLAVGQATPSKTPIPTASNTANIESSPNFRFRFKSPSSVLRGSKPDEAELSPSSRNILKDAGITGTPGAGCRALFGTSEWSSKADVSPQRKKAEAKGKMARFNDAHMKQFKNMDSIANHPSAFRADPARFKPVIGQSAKKSPSKPDVAKPEAGKLKRTQSKMDLAESSNSKRTQPKTAATDSGSKIPPTPLKRTQSRTDSTGSSLSRPGPSSQEGEGDRNPAAKRVKRTESDDAATTRPAPSENKTDAPTVATPARKITSQTALPRLAARLMTPTKSSVARSQSVKHVKTTSMIPALGRSPSTTNLARSSSTDQTMSPSSNLANLRAMRDNAKESMRKASHNLQRVRSILRTPNRKFSNDPTKVAAGTHMSPPVSSNFENASLAIPATAPVKKHVNFSTSTLERASHEELGKSPSPMKFRAGTEVPTGAVIYPNLGAVVKYPELSQDADTLTNSPSRRLVFGGETPNHPRSFSFESGQAINFGPASSGTIRKVRNSDPSEDKKRKLQALQETSDKENDGPAEDETRSTKKAKLATPTPKTPAKTNKMPRNTPGGRSSTISKSRLAFLATPKRSKV